MGSADRSGRAIWAAPSASPGALRAAISVSTRTRVCGTALPSAGSSRAASAASSGPTPQRPLLRPRTSSSTRSSDMTITKIDLTQRLAGRVAVITGGASGIGLATARRFAAEGATVVIGDFNAEAGEAAAAEVGGLFVAVDVTDEAQVNALFDTAAETYGSVDIAFNNAGISPPEDDSIETTELPAWDRVQDVNLKSVYLC